MSAAPKQVPLPAPLSAPQSLLRIDLQAPGDLERIAAQEGLLPVYAHLYGAGGQELLLLPADSALQERLSALGLSYEVLDANIQDGRYYLLHARSPDSLQKAVGNAQIITRDILAGDGLQREGPTALVKADPDQAAFPSLPGVDIVHLQLHPLVVRAERPIRLPQTLDHNPTIQGMINQVSTITLHSYDAGLSGEFPVTIGGSPYTILTRHTGQALPTEKATQYAYEHFQSLGLPVSYHAYNHPSYGPRRNVIAEQAGLGQPERIFLITAHLDSTSNDPTKYAPGADDNASGSSGVLAAADILSQYDFDCTLRYALFTGEEQGLYGSHAYAQDAYNSGDDIQGVLNLDMIAYNSDASPVVELHTRPGNPDDLAIAGLFSDVIATYHISLTPQVVQDGISASDHYYFWQYGYPAILAIEDMQDFTPYYHTTSDQVETLDQAYFTNFVKAAVGTLAHMGCLLDTGYLAGAVTDAESALPVAGASLSAQRPGAQTYTATSGTDGAYRLDLPAGMYTITAQAEGYAAFTATGIDISKDITTTLDIALNPCHVAQAAFTYAPAQPQVGKPVVFTGTVGITSTLPVSFAWDFGDGHSASGAVATHTYTVSDTYTVTMSAENCAGAATASQPLAIQGAPGLYASADALEVEATYGQTITRSLEIGNSGEETLSWSLAEQPQIPWLDESLKTGELDPQERQESLLSFQAPLAHGFYTTSLVLQSSDPQQPEVNIPVSLRVPCSPVAELDFSSSPATARVGQPTPFASQTAGSLPVVYTWDFGDGSGLFTGEDLAAIEHAFPDSLSTQTYIVTLSVVNACSEAVQATHPVTVLPHQAYLPVLMAAAHEP